MRKDRQDLSDKFHDGADAGDSLFWMIGVVIAGIIAYLAGYQCVVFSLVVFLAIIIIWYFITKRRNT